MGTFHQFITGGGTTLYDLGRSQSPWLPGGILAETGRGTTRAGSGAAWGVVNLGKTYGKSKVKPSKQKLELVGALVLYVKIYYIRYRCSIPIWDDHTYRLSNEAWRNHRLSKGACSAFRGWIRFWWKSYVWVRVMDSRDWSNGTYRYRVFTHSHENILLDTYGLWHEFYLLVLEVIACYNPLTSSWNHHYSSILDGCWCWKKSCSLPLFDGQTWAHDYVSACWRL